jgi:hypothetical protein
MNLALNVKNENDDGVREYSYTITDLKCNLETLETHTRAMFKIMDEQSCWTPQIEDEDEDDDDKPALT